VIAVDVSTAMLNYARQKAQAQGVNNITFVHAGFLNYRHHGQPPADAMVTNMALHHLPDAWKFVALRQMAQILKPGGRLFLSDVVFSFPVDEFEYHTRHFVDSISEAAGADLAAEARVHINQEFSTFDWVIEEMLARVGFKVEVLGKEPMFAVISAPNNKLNREEYTIFMPKRTDIESILIIGAGPIIIGQACEFDYSGVQACKALKAEGYRVILVNSNPATIMTDPEFADATYVNPSPQQPQAHHRQ